MKIFAFIVVLGSFAASTCSAGAIEDGIKAYQYKHYATALRAFTKAAATGNVEAQRRLGFMYYHGDGIPQDNKRAVTLFEQAANGGDVQSAANLGMMYEHGMGVDQDDVGAALWYRKAAELGDPHAQLNTSITFYQGKGVAKDRIEAAKWWTIAMSNGQDWEARFRPTIESAEAKLTAEEIEQGRRQAFEWIAAHKVKP